MARTAKTTTTKVNGKANRISSFVEEALETNDGTFALTCPEPETFDISIVGTSKMLMHRYDCEEVEAKGALQKGSKGKKVDNIESC
jgi:hypothetical protein